MIAEYKLFGGIDANRIIPLIPLFDACTIDFWRYVGNYGFLNRVGLSNDTFNSEISVALKTMFWYNSFFRESGWAENNGIRLEVAFGENDCIMALRILDANTLELLVNL